MYPIHLAGPMSGRRAYTDPISNAVMNSGANPLKIRSDLAAGNLSPDLMNVVLHETTHHAAFITPVGAVLGALMTAHTADAVRYIVDQDEARGLARLAIQGEALSIYFTPLLEGLALFAEFDAAPGDSPIASTVSSVGVRLFCWARIQSLFQQGQARSPYAVFHDYVRDHRTRSDALQRKQYLLARPLAADDGYLLGYLWTKALWRILIGRCRKFIDTDLFLSFIIDYFFNDYRLATLMFNWMDALRSDEKLEATVAAIEYYVFGKRLDDLVENAAAYVDEYERYAGGFAPGQAHQPSTPGSRPSYQNCSVAAISRIKMALAAGSIRSMNLMWPKFTVGPAHLAPVRGTGGGRDRSSGSISRNVSRRRGRPRR